jgi:X-X-X-Leu-X-X-Gly heptad repeat protein
MLAPSQLPGAAGNSTVAGGTLERNRPCHRVVPPLPAGPEPGRNSSPSPSLPCCSLLCWGSTASSPAASPTVRPRQRTGPARRLPAPAAEGRRRKARQRCWPGRYRRGQTLRRCGQDLRRDQRETCSGGGQAPDRRRRTGHRRREDRKGRLHQARARRVQGRRRRPETAGAVQLASGAVQLKGYRGANNDPQAGTGTAALAQALELLQAGAARLQEGSGQLHAGTGKLTAGFATLAGRLNSPNPSNPRSCPGHPAPGGRNRQNPERPGLLAATARMTGGSSRLADGTVALNAGIKGNPGDPANPGLLSGSQALATGASELSEGNTKLASGSTQLATGTDKLADGNARIADGTGTLHSGAAAVPPTGRAARPGHGPGTRGGPGIGLRGCVLRAAQEAAAR